VSKNLQKSSMSRPLWLPASGFYVLAAAIAIGVFFVSWRLLQEGGDETPWIPAGLVASVILSSAVLLREVVLRRAGNRILKTQKQLDRNLKAVGHHSKNAERADKLTIERNSAILHEIRQKSDAANVLSTLPNAHREVFELCERYLGINSRELASVGTGSPRLAPLLKGRDVAEGIHRSHMLSWAEVEARSLGNEARSKSKTAEKIKFAKAALSIIETALEHYPDEAKLKESRDALDEFIASVKITDWIEKGQKAAFRGNYKQSIKHLKDALFFVSRHPHIHDREQTLAKINEELEKSNRSNLNRVVEQK
jgi:tetratricopeptide (TPR) repeat protein